MGYLVKLNKLNIKLNYLVHYNGSSSIIYTNNNNYFFFFNTFPYLYVYYSENILFLDNIF